MRVKTAITSWVFLILSVISYGQNRDIRYGLSGGLNISRIITNGLVSKNIIGYNLGVSVEQFISSRLSISYELGYSTQGGYYPVTGLSGNDKTVTDLSYINLPITLRYRIKNLPISIEGGGQVGYLLSNQNYFSSSKSQTNSNKHTYAIDAGLVGGVGYRISTHWFFDAKYSIGFLPILSDYTAPDPITGVATYHRVAGVYNRTYVIKLYYYL